MPELRPYLMNGARHAGELAEALGGGRVALKRAYEREAHQFLRLGRARATRYAARQNLTGLDTDEFRVFRVDAAGGIEPAGTLVTLAATESVWLPDENIIDGLPPEMHDIAPRGFLARSYAQHHGDLGLPEDVTNWSDNQILIALSRRGEDLLGNLVVGRESFDRFQNLQHETHTANDFPALGQHRIVKFATDATDNARRWQDLLTLEHVALQTLRDAEIEAAETELLDINGLRCLIINRFDRIGEMGRRAVLSLAAASEQVDGTWTDAAEGMQRRGELSDESLHRIALLDAFGALIANTDRHQYNVSLFPAEGGHSVAPAFDQLPMAYAPPASGNLRNSAITAPRPAVNTLAIWEEAQELAAEFWRQASERQLSDSMRAIVREHASR